MIISGRSLNAGMFLYIHLHTPDHLRTYFFAANPALTPTIEVSYLNGAEAPTVESRYPGSRRLQKATYGNVKRAHKNQAVLINEG